MPPESVQLPRKLLGIDQFADATSPRLISAKAAAEALTSVNVVSSYVAEQYWPQIHKMAEEMPQPGFVPLSSLNERVASDLSTDQSR